MNPGTGEHAGVPAPNPGKVAVSQVCAALRTVIDPEIGFDIVSLGLIYGVEIAGAGDLVTVRMTLTTPRCPLAPFMVEQAKKALMGIPGVREAEVRLAWEPEWNASMMASGEVKRRFGLK